MELDKGVGYELNYLGIQCKTKPRPVETKTECLELLGGGGGVFLHIVPNHGVEGFAIKLEATFALLLQFFLKHVLCFDASVISAREPEYIFAEHAMVANQDIFNHVHGVAEVEGVIGIGWGENDGKRLLALRFFGRYEGVLRLPKVRDSLFMLAVDVSRFHARDYTAKSRWGGR